ncbi:MAG: hypothetical protein ACRD9Y_17260, partial [Blastocatellia bacterium]
STIGALKPPVATAGVRFAREKQIEVKARAKAKTALGWSGCLCIGSLSEKTFAEISERAKRENALKLILRG